MFVYTCNVRMRASIANRIRSCALYAMLSMMTSDRRMITSELVIEQLQMKTIETRTGARQARHRPEKGLLSTVVIEDKRSMRIVLDMISLCAERLEAVMNAGIPNTIEADALVEGDQQVSLL